MPVRATLMTAPADKRSAEDVQDLPIFARRCLPDRAWQATPAAANSAVVVSLLSPAGEPFPGHVVEPYGARVISALEPDLREGGSRWSDPGDGIERRHATAEAVAIKGQLGDIRAGQGRLDRDDRSRTEPEEPAGAAGVQEGAEIFDLGAQPVILAIGPASAPAARTARRRAPAGRTGSPARRPGDRNRRGRRAGGAPGGRYRVLRDRDTGAAAGARR